MASRITVTPKGLVIQKELQTETKSQFPPMLNLKLLTQPEHMTIGAKLTSKSARFTSDQFDDLAENPFNSTLTYSRCGYFGPKKKNTLYQENLSKARPMYYPNYQRVSREDYPNSHFKILTPDHTLRHLRPFHPNSARHFNTNLNSSSLLEEVASTQRLPIKYIHHTVFPYTRKDTPAFLKTAIDLKAQKISTTQRNSENSTPTKNIKIEILSDYVEKSIATERKNSNPATNRQEEFQKTMFMEKTVVSDYYSGKILQKYDDHKVDRLKDRYLLTQKNFVGTLKILEKKHKKKIAALSENMNEAPDFMKLMKKTEEETIKTVNGMKAHEEARFRQRINKIQVEKYKDIWSRFHHGVRAKIPNVIDNTKQSQRVQQQNIISEGQRFSSRNDTSREF